MLEFILGVWCRKMHPWRPTGRTGLSTWEMECQSCGRTWALKMSGEHAGCALPAKDYEDAIGWQPPRPQSDDRKEGR